MRGCVAGSLQYPCAEELKEGADNGRSAGKSVEIG